MSPKASQNGAQKPSRRLPEGFKTSLKKGFDFSVNFKAFLVDFGGPRGGPRGFKKASKNDSKTALASKLAFSTPRSPPGAHFGALGPPFWSLRELIFEASAPSSGGTFAGFLCDKGCMMLFACIWKGLWSIFFLREGCPRFARKRRTRRSDARVADLLQASSVFNDLKKKPAWLNGAGPSKGFSCSEPGPAD